MGRTHLPSPVYPDRVRCGRLARRLQIVTAAKFATCNSCLHGVPPADEAKPEPREPE